MPIGKLCLENKTDETKLDNIVLYIIPTTELDWVHGLLFFN